VLRNKGKAVVEHESNLWGEQMAWGRPAGVPALPGLGGFLAQRVLRGGGRKVEVRCACVVRGVFRGGGRDGLEDGEAA